jgi:hypothetical protein
MLLCVLDRTDYHVTELHLGVQAFHFLKCQPAFLGISHDPWWVPTWSHKKKKLKSILTRYFTFSKSP